MNILLTCAGRRNYLVEYFQDALDGKGKVFVLNSTASATSMLVADEAIIAPYLYEEGYVNFVLKICIQNNVKLVISLFDMELPILAQHETLFERSGIKLAISSKDVVDICNDKLLTVDFLKKNKFLFLKTTTNYKQAVKWIESKEIQFPLFVKPRWGMGSVSVEKVENILELEFFFNKIRSDIIESYMSKYNAFDIDNCVIIQEKALGEEYGLDVVNDLEGNYITTFVKHKLVMRSGETDIAETKKINELEKLGKNIGEKLKHRGNLDMDVFWDKSNPIILELNARFGGGYPASHIAGANIPKAYIAWASKQEPMEEWFKIKYNILVFKSISLMSNENKRN